MGLIRLPFDKNKLQKLKLERSDGEKWGFTIQTFGLRFLGDSSQIVNFLTFVDYVELFSRAYEGGLRAGDIIVGIATENGTEALALHMYDTHLNLSPKPNADGQAANFDLVASACDDKELKLTSASSLTSETWTTPPINTTSYPENVEPIVLSEEFACHDWIASELRKAHRELRVRIVREDCVSKLQLYQRRLKLQTLLAIKRFELEQLETQLEFKAQELQHAHDRSNKRHSGSFGSERQLISLGKADRGERTRQRKSASRSMLFGNWRKFSQDSSATTRSQLQQSSTAKHGGSKDAPPGDKQIRRGVHGAVASSFAEFDRAARQRSLSIVSFVDVGFRLHIDALDQRERRSKVTRSDGLIIDDSNKPQHRDDCVSSGPRSPSTVSSPISVESREEVTSRDEIISVSDIHAELS